jgi:hypothetical protein
MSEQRGLVKKAEERNFQQRALGTHTSKSKRGVFWPN